MGNVELRPVKMTLCSAIKWQGWRLVGAAISRGLAGHQSVGVKQLFSFASLVFLFIFFPLSLLFFPSFFSQSLNCHYVNPRVFSLLPFQSSSTSHWVVEWASTCVVLCCLLELNHITIPRALLLAGTLLPQKATLCCC